MTTFILERVWAAGLLLIWQTGTGAKSTSVLYSSFFMSGLCKTGFRGCL